MSNVKAEGRKEVVYTFTAEDEDGMAKVEVKYEDGLLSMKEEEVKEEVLEEPGLGEEGVLEVIDRVDGVDAIGAGLSIASGIKDEAGT